MEAVEHRKLIDLKQTVFATLSDEANRMDISLKKLIENLLEEHAETISLRDKKYSSALNRLIGSAKPNTDLASIKDDRLQYLLSK